MNYQDYQKNSAIALKKRQASLVLKNAYIVDVFSESIYQGDIAIEDGLIVAIGNYNGINEVDLTNKYVTPGFIDAHLHLETTMVMPQELINEASLQGTTTFIVDPHEAVNVAGVAGLNFMIEQTDHVNANVYYMLPSCVPVSKNEENGCDFNIELMKDYLTNPRVLGLGEVMDYTAVVNADKMIHEKLNLFKTRIKDGHAPGLSDERLNAYALAKIKTDHESTSYEYALKQLRCGMNVLIREGSGARNLDNIVKGIVKNKIGLDSFAFCTDDKHIEDIKREGHISYNIRRSIELGIKPIQAIKMATLNAARIYKLEHLGAIAPSYQADLVVLDDLETIKISAVYQQGKLVENKSLNKPIIAKQLLNSIQTINLTTADLQLKVNKQDHIIKVIDHEILTDHLVADLPQQDGYFKADENYNKIVTIERHKKTGNYAIGALQNFNLKGGAIATSIAHDSHNIIIVGDNDESIIEAFKILKENQGGFVIATPKDSLSLPLPIMGLMSNQSHQFVQDRLKEMKNLAYQLGVNPNIDPFVVLSFLSLTVIPKLRLTTKGLYDVEKEVYLK
ncbi:adenine deaminase [Erysipelotrichaceae bacterium OttesenSCG-928-M19]|nr:adenine deaminase [Erysipelotrichaceae bacterium OttesenSCG-928-M19]